MMTHSDIKRANRDREFCSLAAHTGEIVGGIAGALLFIIAMVVLILYRNWKYEQELDSLLWKVNYKDIEIKEKREKDETAGANDAPAKCNSKVSASEILIPRFSPPPRRLIPGTIGGVVAHGDRNHRNVRETFPRSGNLSGRRASFEHLPQPDRLVIFFWSDLPKRLTVYPIYCRIIRDIHFGFTLRNVFSSDFYRLPADEATNDATDSTHQPSVAELESRR